MYLHDYLLACEISKVRTQTLRVINVILAILFTNGSWGGHIVSQGKIKHKKWLL